MQSLRAAQRQQLAEELLQRGGDGRGHHELGARGAAAAALKGGLTQPPEQAARASCTMRRALGPVWRTSSARSNF